MLPTHRQATLVFAHFLTVNITCNRHLSPFGYIVLHFNVFSCLPQAPYEEIKRVIKEASKGPMKGILGYTEDQVNIFPFQDPA